MTRQLNNKEINIYRKASHAKIPVDDLTDEDIVYKKRKRNKRLFKNKPLTKGKKTALIVLLILLAIAIGGAAAFAYVNATMANAIRESNQKAEVNAGDIQSDSQTIQYKGHTYKLNQDIVSILIIGHDNEAQTTANHTSQADMVGVAAINTQTGAITIIGIPRDSMVTVDQYGVDEDGNAAGYVGQTVEQLCLAYTYGKDEFAINNVKASVQRTLYNIPIMYYFDLDESGIAAINDAVGGVTLTALNTIPNTIIQEGKTVTLFGKNARDYVRWRDTTIEGSSLDRQQRQAQYLTEFSKTLLGLVKNDITAIVDVFNTGSEYATTNLDASAVIYLATCCVNNGVNFSNAITLTGTLNTDGYYNEYYLDKEATMQTVIDTYYTQVD